MLAKCANPICGAHFRYLSQGRVFNVPIYETASENGRSEPRKWTAFPQRIEHYWLCAPCLATLTLNLRNGEVSVQPRFRQLTNGDVGKPLPQRAIPSAA